jgi:1-acyl-sn-glycerol-3-phosphate acyltransferase
MPQPTQTPAGEHPVELSQETILAVVRSLTHELHPEDAEEAPIRLDSSLDRDLGLDSLARAELLHRLEQTFAVVLPEQVLAHAQTPRDLLHAARAAAPPSHGGEPAQVLEITRETVEPAPERTRTLLEVLTWHVDAHPERTHIVLYHDDPAQEASISYAALLDGASAIAESLRERGLRPGQSVAIMLPTGRDYFSSFFGVLLAGGIPVPIYPPARPSQLEDHLRRHTRILNNAQISALLTFAEAHAVARLLRAQLEMPVDVLPVEQLRPCAAITAAVPVRPEDIAFLQYTSGSTGSPKGVILTHDNLLANIRSMGQVSGASSRDVFVSWLPLYHDMGLIGAWLGSLYYGSPLVVMSPLAFLSRPVRWLQAIHRHRGTLSGGPNFGFELCLSKIEDADVENLDLSSWRLAFNGAETVSPHTVLAFGQRFAHHGLRPQAIAPVYGLAEATLGLAFTPPGRGPLIERVQREPFVRDGRAIPTASDDSNALEFVACGQPLPGHQIRIVDGTGREVGEREEGRLQFRSPSATSGYYRNREATRQLFHGEWLESGDRAYIAEGDVYITGRSKDVIIRAGRNLYPYELEEAAGNLPGARKGCVAVFGGKDPRSHTERLVIVAETRLGEAGPRAQLRARIQDLSVDLLGMPPDEVILAPPHTVLKTSSGKLRRADTRLQYERGRLLTGPSAPWQQFLRLAGSGLGPWLRRTHRAASNLAYATYTWALLLLLGVMTWLRVVLTGDRRRAWRVAHGAGRLLLRLSGTPLRVHGLHHLPKESAFVVAANHASYLDGLVLTAAMPQPLSFVAKRELARQRVAGPFLRRLGVEFVERFDAQQGVADTRRITDRAGRGAALAFFPEGSFDRMPGLRPFHMGAFLTAVQKRIPVIPVTIRGTRSILRSGSYFPRRGQLDVYVSSPIPPPCAASGPSSEWDRALRLRSAVRAAVLAHCGEPDLAAQRFEHLYDGKPSPPGSASSSPPTV